MYLHEIQASLDAGKKVRRLAWEKTQHLVKLQDALEIDLDAQYRKDVGLEKGADLSVIQGTLTLCEGKDKAEIGYVLTHEDTSSQDWEVL